MNCRSKIIKATDRRAANERIVILIQKISGSEFQIDTGFWKGVLNWASTVPYAGTVPVASDDCHWKLLCHR